MSDKTKNDDQKLTALSWLVHIVGDLAQPLKLGKKSDKGKGLSFIKYSGNLCGSQESQICAKKAYIIYGMEEFFAK